MNDTNLSHSVEKANKPALLGLRVWPAILFVLAMAAARFLPLLADDESMMLMIMMVLGPLVMSLLIAIWWLAFSRATKTERWLGLLGILLLGAGSVFLAHPSMASVGLIFLTIPLGMAAFATACIIGNWMIPPKRLAFILLLTSVGFGATALLRSEGMWGKGALDLHWRWVPSDEETMLSERKSESPSESVEDETWNGLANPEWPRFRGADGASQQSVTRIATDWSGASPRLVWKRRVGPGWSSFAVAGNALFTQEQIGEQETVTCYAADSGDMIWSHSIESRFYDPLGGPGPRATPTLDEGALFVMGANGQLQRLDAKTGQKVWEQDTGKLAERKPPEWGYCSSPLVIENLVVVHVGGAGDLGVMAFGKEDGELAWTAASGDHTYSSPQKCRIHGKDYVGMVSNRGFDLITPATGEMSLVYDWKYGGYRALQPRVIGEKSVVIATQDLGTRRIEIERDEASGELSAKENWTARTFKPDFNDFVVYKDHAFGFQGLIFGCFNLQNGERAWRGGRYGKGQVFLLSEQGLLLVMSETGELVLLQADVNEHVVLEKLQVLEGRTWNHPVVVGNRLYVRNSREAACFELPTLE